MSRIGGEVSCILYLPELGLHAHFILDKSVCAIFCAYTVILPNVLIPFSGQTSFGKAILDHVKVDTDKPDPSPCDPSKNGGGDAGGGGSSGGGGTWSPIGGGGGGDPCANGRCVVIIEQEVAK